MGAIKITEQEKKQALFEVSFNYWKALKLFAFAFASFIVGLSALYWTLSYQYEQRIELSKAHLLTQFDKSMQDNRMRANASLYEGVVSYRGRADFDNIRQIASDQEHFAKDVSISAVSGQKRPLAPGVYQVRFVKVSDKAQAVEPLL